MDCVTWIALDRRRKIEQCLVVLPPELVNDTAIDMGQGELRIELHGPPKISERGVVTFLPAIRQSKLIVQRGTLRLDLEGPGKIRNGPVVHRQPQVGDPA